MKITDFTAYFFFNLPAKLSAFPALLYLFIDYGYSLGPYGTSEVIQT